MLTWEGSSTPQAFWVSCILKTPNTWAYYKLSLKLFPATVPPSHSVPSGWHSACTSHGLPRCQRQWAASCLAIQKQEMCVRLSGRLLRVFVSVFVCGNGWGLVWKSSDRPTERLTTSYSCRLTSLEMLWWREMCHSLMLGAVLWCLSLSCFIFFFFFFFWMVLLFHYLYLHDMMCFIAIQNSLSFTTGCYLHWK